MGLTFLRKSLLVAQALATVAVFQIATTALDENANGAHNQQAHFRGKQLLPGKAHYGRGIR
jgi:hypothetical protein